MDGEASPAEEARLLRELRSNPERRRLLESLARLNKATVRARFPLEVQEVREPWYASSTMWALSGSMAGFAAAFVFIFASPADKQNVDAANTFAAAVEKDAPTTVTVPVVVDDLDALKLGNLPLFASLDSKDSPKSGTLSLSMQPVGFCPAQNDCGRDLQLDLPSNFSTLPAGASFINVRPVTP
jgi:hypothetical protein